MVPVLYIAGSGRSGSTIVARYLESRLDACHVGELRYLWDRGLDEDQLCECGLPFSACPFWTKVMDAACPDGVGAARQRMTQLAPRVDRLRRIPGDTAIAKDWQRWPGRDRAAADVAAYADVLVPVYEQIHAISGAQLVIDSSKDPSYLYALRASGRIDLTVLHLVRDSRAVAYSWTREKLRPEVHWEEQLMKVLPPSLSARRWMENNAALEGYARLWPGSIRVRYEDFAADPDDAVRKVVAASSVELAEPGRAMDRHSFSGNPIRFDTGPLKVSVDSSWTTKMSRRDRRTVSLISAPLLRKYGYPLW